MNDDEITSGVFLFLKGFDGEKARRRAFEKACVRLFKNQLPKVPRDSNHITFFDNKMPPEDGS